MGMGVFHRPIPHPCNLSTVSVHYKNLRFLSWQLSHYKENIYELDPYSNSLFLFCGRRCDRIKALHFEKDGFCLYYKRLDNGRFQWPRDSSEVRNLTRQEYRWLLEGLSIDQPKAIRPAGRKDFRPLCKREKFFLPLMGQKKRCGWVIHITMEPPGDRGDNGFYFSRVTVCVWKTQRFS